MAIAIGSTASDRTGSTNCFDYTMISFTGAANGTGTLDTIEVWLTSKAGTIALWVGTFFLVSGTTYQCRASVNLGDVAVGSKQTFTGLSIDVITGDFLGIKSRAGTGTTIEVDSTGGSGRGYVLGEYIDAGDQASYTISANYIYSLYGTGTEAGVTTYELSVFDGFKAGDTPSEAMAASVAVIDGLKGGDSPVGLGSFSALLTDGFKLGDLSSLLANAYPSISDGAKLGDTTLSDMVASLSMQDGMKLGDIADLLAQMSVEVADGVKLGDVTLAELVEAIIYLSITDGLKVGDSPLASMMASLQISDGIKLSDLALGAIVYSLLIQDGIKLGDVLTLIRTSPAIRAKVREIIAERLGLGKGLKQYTMGEMEEHYTLSEKQKKKDEMK